jgi:hypothetical protein
MIDGDRLRRQRIEVLVAELEGATRRLREAVASAREARERSRQPAAWRAPAEDDPRDRSDGAEHVAHAAHGDEPIR